MRESTTAARRGGTVLRLDRPEVRQSVAASPDAMLAGLRPPVSLDEWQEVPELLGAVKRSVDEDSAPGRYILPGSVRAELETRVWPGTGRLLQVPMYGMSVRELLGHAGRVPFIDRVIDSGLDGITAPDDALIIRDYLDLMLAGSFPEPSLRITATARQRWFAGYVEQMITRDVPAAAPRRDPELLHRYLSNRIKRLVEAPKRYLIDPALVAAVLGLGRDAILYGPDMLGRLLDTFVAAQLRAELAASGNDPRLYHLREEQGRREVDLLIETAGGQLIGIEVSNWIGPLWVRDLRGARLSRWIVGPSG